jgi:hypothetical protein
MDYQNLILSKYSGELDQTFVYVNIATQAIAVLIGGLVLWRLSLMYQRKKIQERQRNNYFTSSYSKHWKK